MIIKMRLVVLMVCVLASAVAVAQLRITSLQPTGVITWTNIARVGAYRVEWANSPTGQWQSFGAQTNLDEILAQTNRVSALVPLTNSPRFHRVGWIQPNALGEWDCNLYDLKGTLVITGRQAITNLRQTSANPPIYSASGLRSFRYAGPPTNSLWYYQFIGTNVAAARLDVIEADLTTQQPTNCFDCGQWLEGTLWPNSWTGYWGHITIVGSWIDGTFQATRR